MSVSEKKGDNILPIISREEQKGLPGTRLGRWYATQPKPARILLKVVVFYLAIVHVAWPILGGIVPGGLRHGCHETDSSLAADGYLEGLMHRGWKLGAPRTAVHEGFIHKDMGGKHGKHHGKHKHDHPHPIGPREAESIFLSTPNNISAKAALKRYTEFAHMAGTGEDHLSALNLKAEWETLFDLPISAPYESVYEAGSHESQDAVYGLPNRTQAKVWVDTYYPILNAPVSRSLSILLPDGDGKIEWSAKLREDIVEGDPGSIHRDSVPTFHGLSVSGNVTGRIVYVGYGRKQDFDAVAEKGISLEGRIALVKYGGNFRGLKIKAAQEAGAIACLIFSDPGDDGEITQENGYEAYPDGPARQPSSVQRGSVQFISKYPGDPSTPGYPSYENATRVPGGNQPSIPSLPISYEDAIPLLNTLKGQGIPASELGSLWEGGLKYLGVEYWTGPGDRDVNFVNEVDTKVTPIWNTMATIPGHITDEIVILGNHRDAWVLGGADPSSGTATQYELLRGLSELLKKGWKPLRTIIIASWDAEEFGLVGSTEWVEDFGEWLQAHSAAYLNLDVSVGGSNWHAAASPSLAKLIRNAAEQVNHPTDVTRSLWSAKADGGDWATHQFAMTGFVEEDVEAFFESDTQVKPLGSGSDYTAFLMGYGIASTDMGFKGGPKDPVYHYHSIYDSFTWQEKYSDAEFGKHVAAAKILGLMTLRLVDGLVLPLNVSQYAMDLSGYQAKVEHIASGLNLSAELSFTNLTNAIATLQDDTGKLDAQADAALEKLRKLLPGHGHHRKLWPGRLEDHIDAHVGNVAGSEMSAHSQGHHKEREGRQNHEHDNKHKHQKKHGKHGRKRSPDPKKLKEIRKVLLELRAINHKLKAFESGFLSKEGIKDREWFKHKGTAPGIWLGYGATTFPALTEALTIDKSSDLAQREIDELTDLISAMGDRIRA